MDDNLAIRITGNTAGLDPAVDHAKSEVMGLSQAMAQMAAGMQASSAEVIQALRGIQAGVEATSRDMRQLGDISAAGFRDMTAQAERTEASISRFGGNLKSMIATYLSFQSGQAIGRLAAELGDAAEATDQLAQKMGVTIGQAQALQVAAADVNIPVEMIGNALAQLDKKMALKPEVFKQLGINISEGASNMEILTTVAEKFKNTADGPEKVAMAMTLMGRAGSQMIPILNQGADGIQQFIDKSKEYGAVNEQAVAQGLLLANSVDTTKYAYAGLKNTLTEAFGPMLIEIVDGMNSLIKGMIDSYNAGGAVSIVFEAIGEVFNGVKDILNTLSEAFTDLFTTSGGDGQLWRDVIKAIIDAVVIVIKGAINIGFAFALALKSIFEETAGYIISWYGTVKQIFDYASLAIDVLKVTFQTFGRVAADALMLRWGSIAADWDAGMAQIQSVVRNRGAQIVAEAKATADQSRAWLKSAADDQAKAGALMNKSIWPTDPKPQPKPEPAKVGGGGSGSGGVDFSGLRKDGGGKEKGDKETLVQKLEAELTAKKTAWAKEQDAQNTAQQFSLQSEADFWSRALERTNLGQKDRTAIEQKWLAARANLRKEEITIQLDNYRDELTLAENNAQTKLEILRRQQAYINQMYGAESREARNAANQIVAAERAAADQRKAIEADVFKTKQALQMAAIDEEAADAELAVQMGRMSAQQRIALDVQFENDRYALRRQALLREQSLVDPSRDPVQYRKINGQIEMLSAQHEQRLTQLKRQGELQRTAIQRQGINALASSWAGTFSQLMTGQISFMDGVKGLWQGLVQMLAGVFAQILQNWLVTQLTALIIGKTSKVSEVAANAAVAGSAAFASTAAIPIIGPALAPAAAAAAYAGAMAFAPLVSAEGGDWQVREGLYQLHADEMVLPAWAAQPLRNMVSAGGSGGGGVPSLGESGRMAGDTHNWYISAIDGPSVKKFFMDNKAFLGQAMQKYARDGGRGGR